VSGDSGSPALPKDSFHHYLPPPLDVTRYSPGDLVLDIGCGPGGQLTQLRDAGFRAIGLEVAVEAALASRALGHPVVRARAEALPVRSNSCRGVLCKVVIPYTDEGLAIAEIGRILAPGGVAILYLHGVGYYLRYLLLPVTWLHVIYAARTIVNSWVYRVLGRRLPGFLGDTLFQSEARLRRYYCSTGLTLEVVIPSRRFLGARVFIGHVVRKTELTTHCPLGHDAPGN
jgi:SAM-dependent methyltransferase